MEKRRKTASKYIWNIMFMNIQVTEVYTLYNMAK